MRMTLQKIGYVAIIALFLAECPKMWAQSVLGTNLIVNGDAESGTASKSVSTLVPSIPGWTRAGNVNVLSYGITNYLLTTNPSPPDRGFQYFAGAGYPAPLTMTQTHRRFVSRIHHQRGQREVHGFGLPGR